MSGPKLVDIGTRKVPVLIGDGLTELYFTAGVHGKKEAGFYRFWTCCGEDRYGRIEIIGRARRRLNAGDRIARMSMERTTENPPAHRRIYARMYRLLQKHAHFVRPATEREVSRWADSHKKDMAFARKACVIRGRKYAKLPRVP